MLTLLGGYFIGLILGLRHALEPDHLMAVSTVMTDRHSHRNRPWMLGATWGLGHTLSLFVVGGWLAVLQRHMPEQMAAGFEAAVGIMLIVLGIRAIVRAVREGKEGPSIVHQHRMLVHDHPGQPGHVHLGRWTFLPRPLVVGLVHGLAGSGAISALVLAELPTVATRLSYIFLFGLGSIFGMGALTWVAGRPLSHIRRFNFFSPYIQGLAGLCSGIFGMYWFTSAMRQVLFLHL